MRKDVYLKKEVQIDELVLNPLFTTGGKVQTEKAKSVLKIAKALEKKQMKSGAVWMTNGKTSKLVSKANIKKAKEEGFKLSKVKV
jgi:hypothetical protein